jgi:cysteine-rich repeat protein
VYAGSGNLSKPGAVVVFERDPSTGALTFLAAQREPIGTCPIFVDGVAVSPDGAHLYGVGPDAIVAYVRDACGSGVVAAREQCDDGNITSGDGCSGACKLELCGPVPATGCRTPTLPAMSLLKIKNKDNDSKDQLLWNWANGEATTAAEFGNPVTSTSYLLCVYDSSAAPQPLMTLAAPSGGLCQGRPCWTASNNGTKFRYKDKLLVPDGLQLALLKEGLLDGKAKVKFKAKGSPLPLAPTPFTLPVTVQVKNTDTSVCWEAVFSAPSMNDAEGFKAKSD